MKILLKCIIYPFNSSSLLIFNFKNEFYEIVHQLFRHFSFLKILKIFLFFNSFFSMEVLILRLHPLNFSSSIKVRLRSTGIPVTFYSSHQKIIKKDGSIPPLSTIDFEFLFNFTPIILSLCFIQLTYKKAQEIMFIYGTYLSGFYPKSVTFKLVQMHYTARSRLLLYENGTLGVLPFQYIIILVIYYTNILLYM